MKIKEQIHSEEITFQTIAIGEGIIVRNSKNNKNNHNEESDTYTDTNSINNIAISDIDATLPILNLASVLSNRGQKNDKKILNIGNIKTLQPNEKYKDNGLGVLEITGVGDKRATEFMRVVDTVSKSSIKARNTELLRLREYPYIKRNSILTEAEKKLYNILDKRLPKETVIFPKVRLADIINLNEAVTRDNKAFLKIAYKHVDFAIVSRATLDLICIVELDDFTHDTTAAKSRDQFVENVLRQCGIQLYRIKTRIDLVTYEDTKPIEMWALQYLAPICPICGRPMEPKESKRKSNYGHRFYGCMGFYERGDKKCTYTIDID